MLNRFAFTATLARMRLDILDDVREFNEDAIAREKRRIDERYNKEIQYTEGDEDLAEYAADEWYRLGTKIRDALNSGLCIVVYSTLETHTKVICELGPHIRTPPPARSLENFPKRGRQSILQHHLNYVREEMGIAVDMASESWKQIDYLRRIRNVIAHNDGVINDDGRDGRELLDYCERQKDFFEIGANGNLRIHAAYFPFILKTIREWLMSFYESNGVKGVQWL